MPIEQHTVVTMHYHLTNPEGQVLDSSRDDEPLTYLHGGGNILAGLERELTGLDVGATKTVNLSAADGYGEYDASMVQSVPRQDLAGLPNLEVGMQLQANRSDGQTMIVEIKEIREDTVVVDGNHPLAGVPLTFEIEIVSIREATAEELQHGHVHGEGGHHH